MAQNYKVFMDEKVIFINELKKNIKIIDKTTDSDLLTEENRKTILDKNENYTVYSKNTSETLKLLFSEYSMVEAAGCLVKNKSNKFLVIKRNGIWDLPKGKLEKNENIEECAVREILEETGVYCEIESELIVTYHTYFRNTNVLKPTYWFKANETTKSTIQPQEEEGIEEVLWLSKNEVETIVFPKTFPAIIDVFENDNRF
jgi:8-oxo-dGTP pyrophosphatase MutT (NUDIX family)